MELVHLSHSDRALAASSVSIPNLPDGVTELVSASQPVDGEPDDSSPASPMSTTPPPSISARLFQAITRAFSMKYTIAVATVLGTLVAILGLAIFSVRSDAFQRWSAAKEFFELCQDESQNRTNPHCRRIAGKYLDAPPYGSDLYFKDIAKRDTYSRFLAVSSFNWYTAIVVYIISVFVLGMSAGVLVLSLCQSTQRRGKMRRVLLCDESPLRLDEHISSSSNAEALRVSEDTVEVTQVSGTSWPRSLTQRVREASPSHNRNLAPSIASSAASTDVTSSNNPTNTPSIVESPRNEVKEIHQVQPSIPQLHFTFRKDSPVVTGVRHRKSRIQRAVNVVPSDTRVDVKEVEFRARHVFERRAKDVEVPKQVVAIPTSAANEPMGEEDSYNGVLALPATFRERVLWGLSKVAPEIIPHIFKGNEAKGAHFQNDLDKRVRAIREMLASEMSDETKTQEWAKQYTAIQAMMKELR
jgi:hypothetical protein